MRVVVCGSRNWPKTSMWFITRKMIELIPQDSEVITGGAPGVDLHAHLDALRLGYRARVIRADWNLYGKRAGFLRNLAMLDQKPDLVLAFRYQLSRGTEHTIREAVKRGITVYQFTEHDL